ncbi:unnamed protein product, partial [Enterobius vermicularis]|uniref:Muscle M-line assembly protein unc-89 n=1 Tax=Enterobius vermicularis TaxID=51028 RepID=A0A0N4VF89_ENTVE
MPLRCLYIIELTDTEEGGLELVDPSWSAEQDSTEIETTTAPDVEMNMSDIRSEFSEYSTVSRKSSLYNGPEEGPPRKKVKSPPVISPTGSSTSLYSGGSSSIDWTTTGTTLEMQGTRVTRTQYGFRTLQESSAKMCLKVTGYPLPVITWYKDDQLLQEDNRHTFYADEDGFFALTIDPVQIEDTGRYTCMATNEYGQASTSAFFKVIKVEKEAAPPAFVNTLKDQEVKEGEVACFECEVEGWPEPELMWLVDDQPLRPSHDFRLDYDGQNARLEIRDAQPEDTGTYTVRIKNEYGSAESNAKLTVEPDPDRNHVAPEFQTSMEDVECDEGDDVRFKTVLTGDPNPEVSWLVNGIPLTESDKIKFISEDGICILTIKNVTRHFDGIVSCMGVNRLGSQISEARLKVRIPPTPPQFDRPLEDKIVQEGSRILYDIEISGYPEPSISSGDYGIEISGRGEGIYRLDVTSADVQKHDAEFACIAINEHGQAESRARVVVEPVEEESRAAPTFIKDIEDQKVKLGELAVFETSVRGNPKPEVSWFINGRKLEKNTPGVRIETTDMDHKITIDSAQYAGTVLCRAENAVGRYETKAKLTVLSPEKPKKKPTVKEGLQDQTIVEESTVTFEAEIEGEPKPTYKWYLNETQLEESENILIREFAGSCKIELHNVSLKQGGTIKLVAENSEGSCESVAKLIVTEKPHAPKFTVKPKNVTVVRGSEARFEAEAKSIPEATYQWAINGRKIRDTTTGARIESADGVSILILDTAIWDSGTVTVLAENAQGCDEAGALLTVEEKKAETMEEKTDVHIAEETGEHKVVESRAEERYEEISMTQRRMEVRKNLEDQYVKPGETAQFEVIVQNADELQWYNNGKLLSDDMPGVKITSTQNYEFRLNIDSTQYAGVITVKAKTAFETLETSANLVVEEPSVPPQMTSQLQNITVTEGQTLKMEIRSDRDSKFEWKLNDKPLKGMENVEITEEKTYSKMEIKDVTKEHAGKVTVTAINETGETSSTSEVTVKERTEPPIIMKGPQTVSIKEGEDAKFTAEFVGKPTPTATWTLNSETLVETVNRVEIITEEHKSSVNIKKCTVKDSGEIAIITENTLGKDIRTAILQVSPDEKKPVFETQLIDRSVDEGEPLRWDVRIARPYDSTKVSWYLNEKELISSEEVQIINHGDGHHHVTISEARTEMNGILVCRAENSFGTSESRATINVKEVDSKPVFTRSIQDHETVEGESVKFSAIVRGRPTPKIVWYLNEEEVKSSEEISIKRDESTGKVSLKILKPVESQTGKITIRASNSVGETESSAKLVVEKKKEPPRFLADMDSRQVYEGDTVKFAVTVAGTPTPEVQWFLNGEPVASTSNITIVEENGTHTVTMKQVIPEQSGEISCEARNSAGHKKQHATLTVKPTGEAPTFAKNLEDRLVEEGGKLHMEATLSKTKPKPEITWLRDGSPLKDKRFITGMTEDGVLTLDIEETQLSDKSRITIRAENSFGIAECCASIGVQKKRPLAKPSFLSDIAPIFVKEGDTLEAKVLITGDPSPFAKWYINDQLVVETEDTEIKSENGIYTLKIFGASRDMTGTIKCTAYNRMGEITTEGKIEVISAIPVEFESTLCDATCREGDTLKLKAVLLGEPTPDVTWYINGKKLQESQNVKIHAEKGTYTVTIKDITIEYSGKVVCEAVNEFGKASSEAMLLVLPRGEPPDFIEWLSNIKARQGSQVKHKVVFTGDPRPTLTWYINGEEMHNSEEISIVTEQNTSTLTIKSFKAEKHTGEIICRAENEAGEVSCTASMGVYTSEMYSESTSEAMAEEIDTVSEQGTDNEESLAESAQIRTPTPILAPKFITKIKDTRTAKGSQAIFECVVPDSKGVVCKWLKDGKEIELIARIRVQTRSIEGFTTTELIIDDVQTDDAGLYSVVVENVAGMETCQANLYVVEELKKPESRAPEFTIALRDKSTQAGEKSVFECKVTGEPQPKVTWYHEKIELEDTGKKVKIESSGDIQRLTIASTEFDDHGKYTCVAENEAGTTRSEATLTVHAEAPQFTRHITDKEISIGEKLILECSVSGLPKPVVQFFSQSTKLVSNNRVSVEHDQTNVHWRLVIKELTKEDFQTYTAVATNSVGVAESKATVKEKEVVVEKESVEATALEFPRFTEELSTVTVQESETAQFSVVVSGKPEPVLEWYKDGKPITVDHTHVITKEEDGRHILIIKEARTEDVGTYSCKATNKAGSLEVAAQLAVEVALQPVFKETLTEVKVHENETARLSVVVEGKPQPVVQWLKDGFPVNIDNEHILTKIDENGRHELVIKEARVTDSGTYSCTATNKAGTVETTANFAVEETLEAPKFTQELVEMSVTPGDTAELVVSVEGRPMPKVEWLKDGISVNIDNVSVFTKKDDRGQHTLIIKNAKVEDSGKYICKATNDLGTVETQCNFTIVEVTKAPTFEEGLCDVSVQEAESASLSVVVSGTPTPAVQWFKNGAPIDIDNTHILVAREAEGRHTLYIKCVNLEDAGTYSCKAENKAGVVESKANFAVQEILEVPRFVEELQPVTVEENQTATLSIVVDGRPQPEVQWYKDGTLITIDGDHYIEKKNGVGRHELIIRQARTEDVGAYSCKATNAVGKAETEANFAVEQSVKLPQFTEELEELSVTQGETATLKVSVEGTPQPEVTWLKAGVPVQIDNVHLIAKKDEKGQYSLTIKNATVEDAGTYSCKATNAAGTAETEAKFAVEKTVSVPHFTEQLEELSVVQGETATLKVSVEGSPQPEVTWMKSGVPVNIDNVNIIAKEDEKGHYSLIIKKATAEDAGTYSCKATNAAGTATTEAKFAVEETVSVPHFTEQLEELSVSQGETATLKVSVEGTPQPEVTWLKAGVPVQIDNVHLIAKKDEKGQYSLTIKNATVEDAGTYSCKATNAAGTAETEAKFAVEKTVSVPHFTEQLEELSVVQGETATLKVSVEGSPQPEITWTKSGAPVNIDNVHIIAKEDEKGHYSLIIKKATAEDAGT